jgi:ribosomal protein L24
LKPVPPRKKGDWIVVITGDHPGVVAEVIACRTKFSNAEVVINGVKKALHFSSICRLTRPD